MASPISNGMDSLISVGAGIFVIVIILALAFQTYAGGAKNLEAYGNGSLQANPTGGIAPYTYQWSYNGICAESIGGATQQTYNPNGAHGTYSVLITDTASSTVCVAISI